MRGKETVLCPVPTIFFLFYNFRWSDYSKLRLDFHLFHCSNNKLHRYAIQDSGFMDTELFLKWFEDTFVHYARPTPERPVLLLLDSHISHCSIQVIESARNNNVTLLALPPHTNHICQPLDVVVYKSLKTRLSKAVKFGQALRGDLWIPKYNVARVIKKPFEDSMTISNIKSGIRKTGIYPFNPNGIDKRQLIRNNSTLANEDIDLSMPPVDEEAVSYWELVFNHCIHL